MRGRVIWGWRRASLHPSPKHVMIVQRIGFAALSVKEGILAVFLTEAKALRSRAVVRGRVIWGWMRAKVAAWAG